MLPWPAGARRSSVLRSYRLVKAFKTNAYIGGRPNRKAGEGGHAGGSQRMQPDVNTLLKGVRSPRQIGDGYGVTSHPSGSSAVGPPHGGTVAPSTLATCTSARASNPADGQLQDTLSAPGEMPADARSLCVRVWGEGPRSRSACRNRRPPVPLDSSSPRPPPGTHNGLCTGDFVCISTNPPNRLRRKTEKSPKEMSTGRS